MEERKVNAIVPVVSKSTDSKNAINRPKGSGSPFKCIGSGLVQQRTSEIDEELSSARKRIRELEAIAAARQKEVRPLASVLQPKLTYFHQASGMAARSESNEPRINCSSNCIWRYL